MPDTIVTSLVYDDSGVQTAATRIEAANQRIVASTDAAAAATDRIGAANLRLAETQRQVTASSSGSVSAYDRLKRSIDPSYDATIRIEKATRDADAAVRAGKETDAGKASTLAMGDSYEIEHLQHGTKVYQFGNIGTSLRLISLICSDAFAFFEEQAAAIYQRTFVLHIQLNEKPRQHQYRQRLFYYQGDETELLCLNWAGGVCEWSNTSRTRSSRNIRGQGSARAVHFAHFARLRHGPGLARKASETPRRQVEAVGAYKAKFAHADGTCAGSGGP